MVQADLTDTRGLCLEYDTFGNPNDPTVLLIMGLTTQMVKWRPGFIKELVDRGFHVVRFDNRDVGLSTHLDHLGPAPFWTNAVWYLLGYQGNSAYTLDDMCDDAIALLDYLHIEKAHIVGSSMGGMISQLCALNHPDRVLSLTSIMSTTGDNSLPATSWPVKLSMLAPRPTDKEGIATFMLQRLRQINTPEIFDEFKSEFEAAVIESTERSLRTDQGRQLAACLAAADRTERLKNLKCKCTVVHGMKDPMIPFACGVATMQAIPGSKLILIANNASIKIQIEEMAHGLPCSAWVQVADAIAAMKE